MAAERGVEVGAAMEVAGLHSDGFPASWSSAVVTKVFDAGTIIPHCVVAFDDVSAVSRLVLTTSALSEFVRRRPRAAIATCRPGPTAGGVARGGVMP